MLLPDKHILARLLAHYRAHERAVLARPHEAALRSRFEDCAYTLCVLMGERTAREAVHAAERYLGRPRACGPTGPAPRGTGPLGPAPRRPS
ncbi:DUF5133 domain-containing protein [Streptomyces sp. NPDC059070]|uniref:DUF5133 domain-containing protein n=1 Tax=Streptomyces sp. NPDC059070 TaxID=3346713 RepID=UPI003698EFFE